MSDSLTHYGVKGMKWGVRRSRGSSTSGKQRRSGSIRIYDASKSYDPASTSSKYLYKSLKQGKRAQKLAIAAIGSTAVAGLGASLIGHGGDGVGVAMTVLGSVGAVTLGSAHAVEKTRSSYNANKYYQEKSKEGNLRRRNSNKEYYDADGMVYRVSG